MFADMQIVRTVSGMAGLGRQWRQKGARVALVPTLSECDEAIAAWRKVRA